MDIESQEKIEAVLKNLKEAFSLFPDRYFIKDWQIGSLFWKIKIRII